MTPTIAIVGEGRVLDDLRRRASRAGVPIDDNRSTVAVTVIEGVAPQPDYLGVMTVGEPDRIYCTAETAGYVLAMLVELAASGASGVRVRPPVVNEWAVVGTARKQTRRLKRFNPIEFDWDTEESADSEVFDEEVSLAADGEESTARIRVQGHMNPSDGLFHWAGTAYGDDVRRWRDARVREVEITARSGRSAYAKLTDVTQWGTVRLVGVGAPPY